MEPDTSISSELSLNRRQSVSFRLPMSTSEPDLSTLHSGQYNFEDDLDLKGTYSGTSSEEVIDKEVTFPDADDYYDSRRESIASSVDISLRALPTDNVVIGLSIVYAFVMSIVGLVIPISEALNHTWLNTIYGAVFLTYQLAFGILFLLYLQFYHLKKGHARRQSINLQGNDSPGNSDPYRNRGASVSRRQSIGSTIWVDMTSFGDIFTHPETSVFLRVGTLVFSLGNLIYYGFEIASYMSSSDDCRSKHRFGWTFYLRFAFILLQTYFLFKNSGISLIKHIHGVWFGMLHLASTNICLWFRTVVHEIMEEVELFQQSQNHGPSDYGGTSNYGVTDPTFHADAPSNYSKYGDGCKDELLDTMSRYLFPFVLEYSLIAVGTVTSLLHVMIVTKNDHGKRIQDIRNNFRVVSLHKRKPNLGDAEDPEPASSSSGEELNILGKSHRGFFLAALVIAGIVAAVILFYQVPQRRRDSCLPTLIFYSTDMCLHVFMFAGCVMAFVQMRPLGFIPKTISTDDVLIVIAMCGSVMYDVAAIIASSDSLSRPSPDKRTDILRLSTSLVSFVQVIAQSLLLLCSLRRYPSDTDHVERKPGRGAITTLIMGNVATWVFRTILAKGSDMKTQELFYGDVPWLMLMDVQLPLALFFCFHSSICFADIWHQAYTPLGCSSSNSNSSPVSRSSSMSNVVSGPKTQIISEMARTSNPIFVIG